MTSFSAATPIRAGPGSNRASEDEEGTDRQGHRRCDGRNVCRCGTYVRIRAAIKDAPRHSSEEIDDAIADESRRAFRACRLSTSQATRLSRREFLQATGVAGAGLMLGIALPPGGRLAMAQDNRKFVYPPTAFIRIGADDSVTILINKLEFGQA